MSPLLLVWGCSSPDAAQIPNAIGGVIDLSEYDLNEGLILELKGEWEFYWEEFIDPKDRRVPNVFAAVPGPWNKTIVDGEELGGMGFASYRLLVILPETAVGERLTLRLPNMGTAYAAFINGEKIVQTGLIGENRESTEPQYLMHYWNFVPHSKEISLLFHVSNFHHRAGGLWYSPKIGNRESIKAHRERNRFIDVFVFSVLLIMGVYHIGLYMSRRQDKQSLYFGGFCVLFGIRETAISELHLATLIPGISWANLLRIDYICLYLSTALFISYFAELFSEKSKRIVQGTVVLMALFFSGTAIFLDSTIFSRFINYFQLLLMLGFIWFISLGYVSIKKKKEGALLSFLGMGFFLALGINDILHANFIIITGYYSSYGFIVFIFAQSYIISHIFARAYNMEEELGKNLELRVKERTEELTHTLEELRQTQNQLIETEKMAALGQIVSGVAHEINTPLGVIRASAGNIRDALSSAYTNLPQIYQNLTDEERTLIVRMVYESVRSESHFPSRERRKLREGLTAHLESLRLDSPSEVADTLMEMGIHEGLDIFMPLLQHANVKGLITLAYNLSSQHRNSDAIKMSVNRASKTVLALKNYAHYDRSGKKVEANIADGIETVLTLYQNKIEQGVELLTSGLNNIPDISCRVDELNQVWTNLIHNALQSMDYQGRLEILAGYDDNHLWVEFVDSGKGIPEKNLEKSFDAHFVTQPDSVGSGLGLSISKKIIEEHGGCITVESKPGRTAFRVYLPINDVREGIA